MKLHTLLKVSLSVGLLTSGLTLLSATSCSAEPLSPAAPAPAAQTGSVSAASTSTATNTTTTTTTKEADKTAKTPAVDLDPASQRVEQAKLKLDQARNQLSAARAMLKAAEAEFRAAKADKEALSARNEAMKLADASGLKDDGVQPVQPQAAITFGANRLYPATVTPANAPAPATATAQELSTTRIQQADFNAPQKDDAAASADASADLKPAKMAESQSQSAQ